MASVIALQPRGQFAPLQDTAPVAPPSRAEALAQILLTDAQVSPHAMVEALRRGDQVVTAGGIVGKVVKVGEDGIVEVEIAEGVKVKVVRQTITQVMNKTEPAAA